MAASAKSHIARSGGSAQARPFRLLLIISAVIVLVALPVLPLQFSGLSSGSLQLGDLGHWFADRSRQNKTVAGVAPGTAPGARSRPVEPVALLEQAARDLDLQIARAPRDPALENRLGLVYMGLGELGKAQDHFARAVELARVGIASTGSRQQTCQAQGQLAEASLLVLESSRLNVELSAAHSNLARIYDRWGQRARVVAELDALNREGSIAPSAPQATPGTAAATGHPLSPMVAGLLSRAEAFMHSQHFAEAMQDFRNLLAVDPHVSPAHRDLGVVYAMSGNTAGAVEELETALRQDPRDAIAHNNLGLAYQALGKSGEAKMQFEEALSTNPKLVDASINLGNLYAAKGNYGYARQVLESACAANPRSAVAHNNLGTVMSLADDTDHAIEQFRQAVAVDANLVSAHYGLGLALFKARNYKESVMELKHALILEPRLAGAHEKIEQAMRRAAAGGPF